MKAFRDIARSLLLAVFFLAVVVPLMIAGVTRAAGFVGMPP